MGVLMNEDRTKLFVDCNCGCDDGIMIRVDIEDPEYYCLLTYTNGNWYRDQGDKIHRVIERKLKKIWSIIRNKDYYYSDIIMTRDEFLEFKDFINNV